MPNSRKEGSDRVACSLCCQLSRVLGFQGLGPVHRAMAAVRPPSAMPQGGSIVMADTATQTTVPPLVVCSRRAQWPEFELDAGESACGRTPSAGTSAGGQRRIGLEAKAMVVLVHSRQLPCELFAANGPASRGRWLVQGGFEASCTDRPARGRPQIPERLGQGPLPTNGPQGAPLAIARGLPGLFSSGC